MKRTGRRRRWRSALGLIRDEISDERATIRGRALEVAAFTATINLLIHQRAGANRSIRRAKARLARLRLDRRRGVRK